MAVVIMGTSSSGKTSLIHELKKIYGKRYEYELLDSFLESYLPIHPFPEIQPELDEKSKEQVQENYMSALVDSFYDSVKKKTLKGKNVFVDIVPSLNDPENEQQQMLHALNGIKVVEILLYCPLDILESRVAKRNMNPEEQRYMLQAAAQYQILYKAEESDSEKVLDNSSTKSMKEIRRAAIKSFMEAAPSDVTKEQISEAEKANKDGYKQYIKQFKLDELSYVNIVPKIHYDLILDCRQTSAELAQAVVNFLKNVN